MAPTELLSPWRVPPIAVPALLPNGVSRQGVPAVGGAGPCRHVRLARVAIRGTSGGVVDRATGGIAGGYRCRGSAGRDSALTNTSSSAPTCCSSSATIRSTTTGSGAADTGTGAGPDDGPLRVRGDTGPSGSAGTGPAGRAAICAAQAVEAGEAIDDPESASAVHLPVHTWVYTRL
jgi:hypothetical protein